MRRAGTTRMLRHAAPGGIRRSASATRSPSRHPSPGGELASVPWIDVLQGSIGNAGVARIMATPSGAAGARRPARTSQPLIQRHASAEHYLLGQTAPAQLEMIAQARTDLLRPGTTATELGAQTRRHNEVCHAIEQEMDRLESWTRNPPSTIREQTLAGGARLAPAAPRTPRRGPGSGGARSGGARPQATGQWNVPILELEMSDGTAYAAYAEVNTLPDMFGNLADMRTNSTVAQMNSILAGVRSQSMLYLANVLRELRGEAETNSPTLARARNRARAMGIIIDPRTGRVQSDRMSLARVLARRFQVTDERILRILDAINPPGDERVGEIGEHTGARDLVEAVMTALGVGGGTVQEWGAKVDDVLMSIDLDEATGGADGASKASGRSYFGALARNACHFAPDSWGFWEQYHRQARQHAEAAAAGYRQARQQGPRRGQATLEAANRAANQAMVTNAFGEHYLQDSFAGGHLIPKTRVMQAFVGWLDSSGTAERLLSPGGALHRAVSDALELAGHRLPPGLEDQHEQLLRLRQMARQGNLANPQAVQNELHENGSMTSEQLDRRLGTRSPEMRFMVWWREQAVNNGWERSITVEQAARGYGVSQREAKRLLDDLCGTGYAARSTGSVDSLMDGLMGTHHYVIDSRVVENERRRRGFGVGDRLGSELGLTTGPRAGRDVDEMTAEYNVQSFHTFFNSAMVQFGTKIFHDKYCKEGLVVESEVGPVGRIFGDNNMLNGTQGGAQNGVEKSARASQDSRNAIFAMIRGSRPAKTPEQIKAQFPSKVSDEKLGTVPLSAWQDHLVASVPQIADEEFRANPALEGMIDTTSIVDRFLGGVSGTGRAVQADAADQQGQNAQLSF